MTIIQLEKFNDYTFKDCCTSKKFYTYKNMNKTNWYIKTENIKKNKCK